MPGRAPQVPQGWASAKPTQCPASEAKPRSCCQQATSEVGELASPA